MGRVEFNIWPFGLEFDHTIAFWSHLVRPHSAGWPRGGRVHLLRDDHHRHRDRRRATGSRRIGGGSLVAALAALRARGRRAAHAARPGTERRRQAHQASKGGGLTVGIAGYRRALAFVAAASICRLHSCIDNLTAQFVASHLNKSTVVPI